MNAASVRGNSLLEVLVYDLGHLEHRHLRLAKDLPQLLVGIDHALVDGVLQLVLLDVFSGFLHYLRRYDGNVTHLTAGKYKALANPDEPLSELARKEIQEKLDYSEFLPVRFPTIAGCQTTRFAAAWPKAKFLWTSRPRKLVWSMKSEASRMRWNTCESKQSTAVDPVVWTA
jgi:hypothetical protein